MWQNKPDFKNPTDVSKVEEFQLPNGPLKINLIDIIGCDELTILRCLHRNFEKWGNTKHPPSSGTYCSRVKITRSVRGCYRLDPGSNLLIYRNLLKICLRRSINRTANMLLIKILRIFRSVGHPRDTKGEGHLWVAKSISIWKQCLKTS